MLKYSSFCEDLVKKCNVQKKDMIIYDVGESFVRYSYENVYKLIKRFVSIFEEKRIKKGETIVTILPNCPEAIICFFAAASCGINYAPLPCTVSKREYDNWVSLVNPKMILIKQDLLEYEYDNEALEVNTDGKFDWLPQTGIDFEKIGGAKVFLSTSGTTGAPKAMQIDVDKLWSSGKAFVEFYNLTHSECRFWNYLPMSYLGGLYNLAMIPLCCNGSFVISEPFSGKTILNFWNFVKKYDINAIWFVPSIVQGLLKMANLVGHKYTELNVKVSFLGTAPISFKVKEEFEETFGIRLYENFALSESTFLTAETTENIRFREQSSVGSILPYVEIKFVPINEVKGVSTIWIKTPYLFDGYLGKDGKLEIELDEDGFFNSKDLGYLNEDDVLVLSGRSRDIIKKGGLFVSLMEVENVVKKIDFIQEVSAVPVKHDFYGEAYILCVIFKEYSNEEAQCEELRKWMLESFVSYKMPEKIVSMSKFPRTASGKIIKKDIEKILKEDGIWRSMN